MKKHLFLSLVLLVLGLSTFAQGKLLYSGVYTSSDCCLVYIGGTLAGSQPEVPKLHDVKIYEKKLYCGSSVYDFCREIKISDGSLAREYKDGAFCFTVYDNLNMLWSFTFSSNTTRVAYFKGNHLGSAGAQVNSGSGGSNGGGTTGTQGRVCYTCNGTGKCSSVAYDQHRCHGTGICQFCNGRGVVTNYYAGGKDMPCSSCDKTGQYVGNGKCSFCHGTGNCQTCGGTGRLL